MKNLRKHSLLLAGTLVLATSIAQILKPSPNPLTDFVLVDQVAYGVLPPQALASNVQTLTLSDSLQKVVAVTKDPNFSPAAKGKILIIDLLSGTQKSALNYPESSTVKPYWIDDKAVLIHLTQLKSGKIVQNLVRVNAGSGRIENLLELSDPEQMVTIYPLYVDNETTYIVNIFSRQEDNDRNIVITDSGEIVVLSPQTLDTWKEKYPRYRGTHMSAQMNTVLGEEEVARIAKSEEKPKQDLYLKRVKARSVDQSEGVARTKSWLVTDHEEWPTRKLVSSDGETFLLRDRTALISLNEGLLSMRKIVKVPRDQFLKIGEETESVELLSKAKQVGTGIQIYMSDYDDVWPLSSGFADGLHPYLKNSSLTDGFEYMRPDKDFADVKDPSSLRIGSVRGRFGSAHVNADGSARWEKKK